MNIPTAPKILGHCTACDAVCYEITAYFEDGHLMERQPRGCGPMLDTAVQIEFMLSDTSLMPLIFCLECADAVKPTDYPAIMKCVVASWEQEISDEYRASLGMPPMKEEQKETFRLTYYLKRIAGQMWRRRESKENIGETEIA